MSYEKALELIKKEKKEKSGKLHFYNFNLKELPNELFELEHLYILNLRNNTVRDYSILANLPNLTHLYLRDPQNKDYTGLKKIRNLTYLSFNSDSQDDLNWLEDFPDLTGLDISYNNICNINFLKKLQNLEYLDISKNTIDNYEILTDLLHLKTLRLNNNHISDYCWLEKIPHLTHLSLYNTRTNKIDFLRKKLDLEYLDLRDNGISDIRSLKKLVKLSFLYLGSNKIRSINALKEMPSLVSLDISYNNIKDITPILPIIEKGIKVSLRHYKIQDPKNKIYLNDNPIVNPPIEIVKQGNKAILRYFAEKEKGAQKLMEAKLLIVGQGGAGKTSLKKKLHDVNAEMPEKGDSTRGIVVSQLDCKTNNGEDFRLNIWDFGGQNVQHYAHQFFLTGSSLYALVTNEREQNPNFQYWLNIIEMLSGKSPVLILQNEIAGHSEPIKNAAAIRERFGNVVNPFQQVDLLKAATDKRFDQLKEEIIHQALRLPHIGKEYPTSYVRVREALENEAKAGKHYVSWSAYKDLCTAVHVGDADVMQDIATTFTILGVCLHFKDDMVLKKFVFLNPKWIIDALFELIYHEKVIAQKGKFSELGAEEIWAHPDYEGMEDKLIRIMENFELCYRMKDSKNYIVPQRLPAEDESYGWNEPHATKVQYAYKFMPKGLITRLTCRLHEKIEEDNVWNDAVIFAMPKARAFVREVYAEEKIAIEVSGDKRGGLLNRILDEVDDIHRKSNFANLQVEKLVPCSCQVCSEAKTPHFFDYDYLIELLDDGEYDERCKESKKKVDIREVLLKTGIDFKKHSRKGDRGIGRWGDVEDLETEGREDQAILLQKKLNLLKQELITSTDSAQRFKIELDIAEAEARLRAIKE